MTSAWQSCQGDYKPLEVFTRDNLTVITRNITEVEDGLYQWEEYAMLTEDYESVVASTTALTNKADDLEARADNTDFLLDDIMTNVIPNLIGGE